MRTWWPFVLGTALAAALALGARGLEGDEEIGHFLIAKHALSQPELFLSPYGRPLVTLGFALPAQAGLWAARLFCALLTGATTLAVVRLAARTQWIHPRFAVGILFLQPYFLGYAATVMAEPWAAMLVAWSFVAFVERRMGLLAIAAGLLPVARQEWIVLWPLVVFALYRDKSLRHLWLLFLPMGLWAVTAALVYGDPLWIVRQVDWRTYARRDLLHYLNRLAWIIGAGLLGPVMVGFSVAGSSLLRREGARDQDPVDTARRRAVGGAALVVIVMMGTYTAFAVLHPVTFGLLRFFAAMAPVFVLLASAGVHAIMQTRKPSVWVGLGLTLAGSLLLWRHPMYEDTTLLGTWDLLPAAAAIAWGLLHLAPRRPGPVAVSIVVLFGVGFLARSHRATLHLVSRPAHLAVAEVAAGLKPHLGRAPVILSANPAVAYYLELNPYDRAVFPKVTPQALVSERGSAWIFWDTHYSPTQGSGFFLSSLLSSGNWTYEGGVVASDSTLAAAAYRWNENVQNRAAVPVLPGTMAEEEWVPRARRIQAGIPRTRQKAEADPGNVEHWNSLAYRQVQIGDVVGALRSVAVAERLSPHDPSSAAIRAAVLLETGQAAQAAAIAREAIRLAPKDGRLPYLLGRSLLELGRPDEAREHLGRAAERLPQDWDAQYVAGVVCARAGAWAQAEQYLGAAVRLRSDSPDASLLLAEARYRQGRKVEAEEALREFIRTDPTQVKAYMRLGELLQERGLPAEARRVWEEGFIQTEDPGLRRRLASSGR